MRGALLMHKTTSLLPRAAIALVIAASLYTLVLCFLHTRVTSLTDTSVAIADGAVVLCALALCMIRPPRWLFILLFVIAANFVILTLFTGVFEPKALRDPLVLLAFVVLGLRYGDENRAKSAFFIVSALVIGFGLFEFLAPGAYTDLFNVIQFYSARGMVDADALAQADSAFFMSGSRDGARMLFPFLGDHRVSSIFLEPVSMGNFGAIAVAYALSFDRSEWRKALTIGAVGFVAIALSDARFGSMAAIVFILVRLLPLKWLRAALPLLPLFAFALLIAFALSDVGNGDDLATRLAGSGRLLLSMSPAAYFGLASYDISSVDSGYAYALSALGLPLCAVLWFAFLRIPAQSAQAQRMHVLTGVYICALLCISGSSLFALKTAALAFFVLGAVAGPQTLRSSARSAPRQRRLQTQQVAA